MPKCIAIAKSTGKRCGCWAMKEEEYCRHHINLETENDSDSSDVDEETLREENEQLRKLIVKKEKEIAVLMKQFSKLIGKKNLTKKDIVTYVNVNSE